MTSGIPLSRRSETVHCPACGRPGQCCHEVDRLREALQKIASRETSMGLDCICDARRVAAEALGVSATSIHNGGSDT